MRRPVILTGPMPTVEEIAAIGGVSKRRVKEIQAIADEIRAAEASRRAAKSTRKKGATKKSSARAKKRVL